MGEQVLRTTRVYDGRVVSLRVDDVQLPSGRTGVREIVEHRGAVAIVPLDAGDVLLVRQFRAATGGDLLEIPAGTLEPGETVEAALDRELAEEIGLRGRRYERLTAFYPSPGILTEVVHLFLATELEPHRLDAEEEDLTVVRLPLLEAVAQIASGEIRDAKSIIGLLLTAQRVTASSDGTTVPGMAVHPERPKQPPPR
jgi:ADP-ribose pyrophosphatase